MSLKNGDKVVLRCTENLGEDIPENSVCTIAGINDFNGERTYDVFVEDQNVNQGQLIEFIDEDQLILVEN
jgi:hypothetical protein